MILTLCKSDYCFDFHFNVSSVWDSILKNFVDPANKAFLNSYNETIWSFNVSFSPSI